MPRYWLADTAITNTALRTLERDARLLVVRQRVGGEWYNCITHNLSDEELASVRAFIRSNRPLEVRQRVNARSNYRMLKLFPMPNETVVTINQAFPQRHPDIKTRPASAERDKDAWWHSKT